MSTPRESDLDEDLEKLIENIGLSRKFVDWMNCIIRASLDDLVEMTSEEYRDYMEDQLTTVQYGYTEKDAAILRSAIKRTQIIRHEEKKITEKQLLAEDIMRAKKYEVRKAAQQTRRDREKVSKDREFDLYRPRIVVPEIDFHDFHHDKIPYTLKELELPRDMRNADLKNFLTNTVHLSKKSVDWNSSQIPRAGARCVKPWLTRDIVWTGSFRRGSARCRGDRRLCT